MQSHKKLFNHPDTTSRELHDQVYVKHKEADSKIWVKYKKICNKYSDQPEKHKPRS